MIKLTKREEKAFTRYLFQQHFIAEGTGRKVYSYNDKYIIKVAKNRNGRKQNHYEVLRYNLFGDKYLARIIAYSHNIVIMEKVACIELNEHNEIALWLDKITGVCSMDHASQGYRIGTTELVAYDYGDTKDTYTKQMSNDYYLRELVMMKPEKNSSTLK